MVTFEYLLTTVGKNQEEIIDLIKQTNISGKFLVGNQKAISNDSVHIEIEDKVIDIFNLTSIGTSRNRNFLLSKSNATYITFLDDDIRLEGINSKDLEDVVSKENKNALRFNVKSLDPTDIFKQLIDIDEVSYMQMKSFGICGIFFKREILLKNSLIFLPFIGPGNFLNHSEDSIFLFNYLKKKNLKLKSLSPCYFVATGSSSTWRKESRNVQRELITRGFQYSYCFGINARFSFIYHIIKYKAKYKGVSFFCKLKLFNIGKKLYKKYKKAIDIDGDIKELESKGY